MVGKVLKLSLLGGSLLLSSCGAMLNPYSSNFQCKLDDFGQCMEVQEAYEKSLKDRKKVKVKEEEKKEEVEAKEETKPSEKIKESYRESLYSTLKSLLDEPQTPVVVPPKVMRVLVMPYSDAENRLFMSRYIYIFVTDPSWILEER